MYGLWFLLKPLLGDYFLKLKFGSVCSGIEAASVAWESLGWKASWFAEIEPFPSAVLSYRFPETMNLGDMTKIAEMVKMGFVEDPDILVGGTPCQAFSVAGSRQSLDDERGQLSLSFITLANTIDEQRIENGKDESIIVWENVPGVLNTKDNAFGCFLGELSGAGCELQPSGKKWTNSGCVFGPQRAVAWRILDAQYFGVAQRRRRVFVVASARKGFNPAEVLFESEGVRRDSAPSRSAGQEVAGSIGDSVASPSRAIGTLCARDVKGVGNQYVGEGKLILPSDTTATYWNGGQTAGTLTKCGMNQLMPDKNNAQLVVCYAKGGDLCDTVTTKWAKGSGGPAGSETGNLVIHGGTVSGKQVFPTLAASMGKKLWLGNQEAFSGDYFVCHGTQDPIIQDNQAFPLGRNQGQENVVAVLGGLHPNAAMGENLCPTITQAMGMGGGHIPIVNTYGIPGNWIGRKPENGGNATEPMDNIAPCQTKTDRHAVAFGIQGSMIGRSINAGPQGSGISDDVSFTLTKGDRHAVAYSFDSLASNSMKSSNPHSGCREVDLSKTIDTTIPCPSKNQGGIGILQSNCFQQNTRDEVRLIGGDGEVAGALMSNEGMKQRNYVAPKLYCGTQNDACRDVGFEVAPTLRAGNGGGSVNQVVNECIPLNSMTMLGRPSDDLKPRMGLGIGSPNDPQNTLSCNHHHAELFNGMVRRLTPIECERLQGFPDNWTQIPYRNKAADQCPDGPRYAACGNSMAVPVMRWIGQRIEKHLEDLELLELLN